MTSTRDASYAERDRRTRQYGGHHDALEQAIHLIVGPDVATTRAGQIAMLALVNLVAGAYQRLVTVTPDVLLRARSSLVPADDLQMGSVVAQKIQTVFIDDLDGSEAEGTVRFGLDGAAYEIDLNAEHARALRDALSRYVQAARRAGGDARRPDRGGRRARADGVDSTEVREWAKAQGIDVKDRGRVPVELVVKFKAATTR